MKCEQIQGKLGAYVAGELAPAEQDAVAAHLSQCAACHEEVSALSRCEQALGLLGTSESAPELTDDLRQRIAARRPTPRPWVWASAAAAAGVVIAALLWPVARAPDVTPPPVIVQAPAPVELDAAVPQQVETVPPPVIVAAPEPPATEVVEVPPTASVPLLVPAEETPQQASSPAAAPVPVQAQPAEFWPEAVMEAAPPVASPPTQPGQTGGVVLLLGQPEPERPAASCYLEVSMPDGARSVYETARGPGAPRVIRMSYEQIASRPQDEGG